MRITNRLFTVGALLMASVGFVSATGLDLSQGKFPTPFPNYPKPYMEGVLMFDPPYQGGNDPIMACWTECVTGPDGVSQMCFQVCDVVGNQ